MENVSNNLSTGDEISSNNQPPSNAASNAAINNHNGAIPRNLPTQDNTSNISQNYAVDGNSGNNDIFHAEHLNVTLPNCDQNTAAFQTHTEVNEELPQRNGIFFDNLMGAFEAQSNDFAVAFVESGAGPSKMSPPVNNSGIPCSLCDDNASTRCLDCNEFICNNCAREHQSSPMSSTHSIISLPTPIGTSPTGGISSSSASTYPTPNYVCDLHNEMLRYICVKCKKLVCQCCTLYEHKDHQHSAIEDFYKKAGETIKLAIESSLIGTRCVRSSIDLSVALLSVIDRNSVEVSDHIRKSYRDIFLTAEDREQKLLQEVEKMRLRRLGNLQDKMAGLKSALSGLAATAETLRNLEINAHNMDQMDLIEKVLNSQRQLTQIADIYMDLQPRQESLLFIPPDYSLLQGIRQQGFIVCVDERHIPLIQSLYNSLSYGAMNSVGNLGVVGTSANGLMENSMNMEGAMGGATGGVLMTANPLRPLLRDISFRNVVSPALSNGDYTNGPNLDWELKVMRNSPNLQFGAPRMNQAIPGSPHIVRAYESYVLSFSFAPEGHSIGQVSRPWGLCVDKFGNILVSDRRNNRVQVFSSYGRLRLIFGRKGTNNGEFDLPAGICVDGENRIIVVDKDNHRIQIFTARGEFLLKFGSCGKEYGQFQYPWDVAVNSRQQIVVSDSRNHRIQQFDSQGRFIRQIVFETYSQTRGIASPRGVCYTPTGNIIVSDFDNHCLYLIDPDVNEIKAVKGKEGNGYPEFNRPSGICCDDEGRIIVADSKNQRIVVFNANLEHLWTIKIRRTNNPFMPQAIDEKDRTCDVALMPDGRIVFLIELSPDSKEGSSPYKRFVHVF